MAPFELPTADHHKESTAMASNKPVNTEEQVTMDPPRLITMPAEVLMKIAQQLPQSSLNTLARTCPKLRSLVKLHGALICNERVASHYPDAVKLFAIQKDSFGWYLPSGGAFLKADRLARDHLSELNTYQYNIRRRVFKLKNSRYTKALQQADLLTPGPQLCAFLDKYHQVIRAKHRQLVTKGGATKADKTKGEEKFNKWVALCAIFTSYQDGSKGLGMAWYHGPFGANKPISLQQSTKSASLKDTKPGMGSV
ncbi:hypothetical protein DL98DRAFT_537732 [Cadophora sp. DSE1049]|nr:hypothetical protein DL98DRAFT_537732 [Cadophora sp. DSE1049]